MTRIRIIGACVFALIAVAAITAAGAPAALPELGICKKVGTGGAYNSNGCVKVAPEHNGRFEWFPGPGEKPKFDGSQIFEATLETVGGTIIGCGPSEFTGEWTGAKTATVSIALKGCLQRSTNKPCQTQPNHQSEINAEGLDGELGFISGAGTERPKVGLDLKPKSPSTAVASFICGGPPGEPVGEPWTVEGSVIGEEKTTSRMKLEYLWVLRAVNGKQIPEKFETGVKDTLIAKRIVGTEMLTEDAGLTLKEERKTFLTENEEPLEVKAK